MFLLVPVCPQGVFFRFFHLLDPVTRLHFNILDSKKSFFENLIAGYIYIG